MWHIPLIAKWVGGVLIAGLAFSGYDIFVAKKGVLTVERKFYFDAMMRANDPAKVRAAAAQFDNWSLPDQATQLRTRATYLEAPPSVQQQRQAVINQAASTTDPSKAAAVQNVANAVATAGDPGTAAALTSVAQNLAGVPPNPNDPQNLPDSDPRSPYFQQWLSSQNPLSATQAPGQAPPVNQGVAQGDGLGGVTSGTVQAPAGTPAPGDIVSGDNSGGAPTDDPNNS